MDPKTTDLHILIRAAWKMHKELVGGGRYAFALFPECNVGVNYVTLDAICITQLYKAIFPDDPLCRSATEFYMKKNGKKVFYTLDKGPLRKERGHVIFKKLFNVNYIKKLHSKDQFFRYSLQTDGYGVSLYIGRYYYWKKKSKPNLSDEGTEDVSGQTNKPPV